MTFDSSRAIVDFGNTAIGQCMAEAPDVAQPAPSAPAPAPPSERLEESQAPGEVPPTAAQNQPIEPKIPISHLIASNQYPSLRSAPPPNIVHSFAPVYVDSSKQGQLNATEELYSSYVNNPYNLTLHVEQQFGGSRVDDEAVGPAPAMQASADSPLGGPSLGVSEPAMAGANMNIFQSAAYFGAQSDATIPPGSEMLFGQP